MSAAAVARCPHWCVDCDPGEWETFHHSAPVEVVAFEGRRLAVLAQVITGPYQEFGADHAVVVKDEQADAVVLTPAAARELAAALAAAAGLADDGLRHHRWTGQRRHPVT